MMDKNKLKIALIKRRMPFKVRKIGEYNISSLLENLSNMDSSWWEEDNYRLKKYVVHQHTNSLAIMWDPDCIRNNKKGKKHERNYDSLGFDEVLDELRPIYEKEFGKGDFHRVLIARLKPNSKIAPHCDGGIPLMMGRRTHIPIATNKDVVFNLGNDLESFHLEAGSIYELNNAKKHAVKNPTDDYRIHLIIDWLQDEGFWLNKQT
jgi:hypothetical protein